MTDEHISAFRPVPRTGVIYVTTEATKLGFHPGDPDWCNLGQGQPETGRAARRAAARAARSPSTPDDQEYAPVAGLWELREAIADALQPALPARACPRSTRAENVSVSGGGRAALTRAAASARAASTSATSCPTTPRTKSCSTSSGASSPIPILLEGERGYALLGRRSAARDPRPRPLGAAARRTRATRPASWSRATSSRRWVRLARELDCTLLLDEFYSHYIWTAAARAAARSRAPRATSRTSTAIRSCIFDGLTKNWRYPGWRVTWTVGPKQVIEAVASAGSLPRRRRLEAAAARGDPAARRTSTSSPETKAIHDRVPREARPHAARGLERIGVRVDRAPEGTFYVWGNVAEPAAAAQRRHGLLPRRARAEGHHRAGRVLRRQPRQAPRRPPSRFRAHTRFSFGPPRCHARARPRPPGDSGDGGQRRARLKGGERSPLAPGLPIRNYPTATDLGDAASPLSSLYRNHRPHPPAHPAPAPGRR